MSKKPTRKATRPVRLERTADDVGHLFRRAGFGATPAEILHAARQGRQATVDRLLNYDSVPDDFSPPDIGSVADRTGLIDPLTTWWLGRMLTTTRPLQEKMTLFWHGHFATANYKVRSPAFMYRQNQIFRQQALGRFDDLLSAVYKDPAMLIWLDGNRNNRFAPNENFGREVMELFTLGHGPESAPNYTEDDVHANARAFTGWIVDTAGSAVFVPRLHDAGPKTLLGHTGNWNGEDAVRILCAHPATGPFLATKLWRFFASDTAPAATINRMARAYYENEHSIKSMVRVMFSDAEFYSSTTKTGHIKSPVEFIVTTLKQLGLVGVDLTSYPFLLAQLGQQLFDPPTVGGWAGGPAWINASTMLTRFNYASRLTGNAPGSMPLIDGPALLDASGTETIDQLVYYVTSLLGVRLSSDTLSALLRYASLGAPHGNRLIDSIDGPTKIRGLIHLTLVSPEYQIA
ncbi:MAG TPA: DUF1800 domain-containing protein [Chloroflexota bacterium]|nr:DUF1800 domain-containing protein [Chloroflexota bacterium]